MMKDYGVMRQCGSGNEMRVFAGSIHPVALVGLFVFFLSSVAYVYALNLGAVQGYQARKVESDIASLKEENRRLRITEAQALSLSRIEESVKGHEMDRATEVRMIGGRGAVAVR
ncbi:MAG: hypothetical protein HGB34_03540 [Candidatus Moranbacteria bacterium]|nr:hypothetical protein [Candidatus Moranbacteria bacterium]NTW75948.1 hypothetical protein [Candidatus Moranbacteria bacterium]